MGTGVNVYIVAQQGWNVMLDSIGDAAEGELESDDYRSEAW